MDQILLQGLILYIGGNKSRLKCLAGMIISLITGSSIYQKGLACGISGKVKARSKIQRVYRFFKEFKFNYTQVTMFIFSLFGQQTYVMALDRTNWQFGKVAINNLFLVIVIGKISVPIAWQSLPHGGACSSEFMQEFLQKFLNDFGSDKIKYLLADREFMNKEWLKFLIDNNIKFTIPLKSDHKICLDKSLKTLVIGEVFNDVKALEYRTCTGILWGHNVHFAAYRNGKNKLMVLVASLAIEVEAFALYQYRWSIERLFKHLKSGGFDIEKSHLVNLDRFSKLLVVTAIAAAMVVKNGLIQNNLTPIRIKNKNNTKVASQLFSMFTYGLDYIKNAFYQSTTAVIQIISDILLPLNPILFPSIHLTTKIVG